MGSVLNLLNWACAVSAKVLAVSKKHTQKIERMEKSHTNSKHDIITENGQTYNQTNPEVSKQVFGDVRQTILPKNIQKESAWYQHG